MKKDDQWQNVRALGLIMSMGITMATATAVGFFVGKYLDKLLHTGPWLTIIMFSLGVAGGLKSIYELMIPRKNKK